MPVELLAVYVLIGIFVLVFNAAGYMMSCVYLSVPQVLMLNYTFPIVTMAGCTIILVAVACSIGQQKSEGAVLVKQD